MNIHIHVFTRRANHRRRRRLGMSWRYWQQVAALSWLL